MGSAGAEKRAPALPLFLSERLVEVPENIFNILDADAETNKVGSHAGAELLIGRELAVRRARGMDGQAFGIAHVSQVAK